MLLDSRWQREGSRSSGCQHKVLRGIVGGLWLQFSPVWLLASILPRLCCAGSEWWRQRPDSHSFFGCKFASSASFCAPVVVVFVNEGMSHYMAAWEVARGLVLNAWLQRSSGVVKRWAQRGAWGRGRPGGHGGERALWEIQDLAAPPPVWHLICMQHHNPPRHGGAAGSHNPPVCSPIFLRCLLLVVLQLASLAELRFFSFSFVFSAHVCPLCCRFLFCSIRQSSLLPVIFFISLGHVCVLAPVLWQLSSKTD